MPLFNLPKSSQEVYNTVAQHMLKQNEKSVTELPDIGNACAYRGRDGLKCAAGCLIPDEVYNCSFENITWFDLVEYHRFPEDHMKLISDLQTIHDVYQPYYWRNSLASLAASYSLNTDVLNAI